MKKLVVLLSILRVFSLVNAQQLTSYDQALEKANQDQKILVLQFSGSDWCAPCIKLEKNILHTPTFQEYAKQFVWLKVDFPQKKANRLSKAQTEENEKIAERYNPKGLFPFLVFIDNDESIVGTIKYHNVSPEEYAKMIDKRLKNK